jgi:transcriptional regulator GlxA family with amidase domain
MDVPRDLDTSVRTLERRFRAEYGYAVAEELRHVRLERAKSLLKRTLC